MKFRISGFFLFFIFYIQISSTYAVHPGGAWKGTLLGAGGRAVAGATVELQCTSGGRMEKASVGLDSNFEFSDLSPCSYQVSVQLHQGLLTLSDKVEIRPSSLLEAWIELSGEVLSFHPGRAPAIPESSGGEHLSSREVAGLPLNKRDFSQLLLLAAGTMTDSNGAANFTQQFAINGQRGTTAVFAQDGIDITDPEMGGATFTNFNVDAVQEIRSSSGVMAAEIGRGAAGYTDIITKSGSNQVHGTVFEYLRNAAFDARNFFDRQSAANPGRIPPFVRNEFGFTNGGPVFIPGLYDGKNRTFYFGQYQGFRQELGTTQMLAVPTPDERKGLNTTAYPGDTLLVPVDPQIAPMLARYPLPNDPQGPYGGRTYATSSKVSTVSDQFSIRIDHKISGKAQLFIRFNLNNVNGPTTNPNQTAIDPSFAIRFFDHQRNTGVTYTRNFSPQLTSETSLGYIRSTPMFPTINQTDPGLHFGDNLYEPFNGAAGSIMGSYGNLFQFRQNFAWVRGKHSLKAGAEIRLNRDSTVFGISPNGDYIFSGGAAYSPINIRSQSGRHDIQVGDPLPDALTGLLTATPVSYNIAVIPPLFPQGDKMGESAISRDAYNFFIQDAWKVSARVLLTLGLRYEVNSRIRERHLLTSRLDLATDPSRFLVNPKDPFKLDGRGWGPRLGVDWGLNDHTLFRVGGAVTTMLPNLWWDNFLTGGTPFSVYPSMTATPGYPVPFSNTKLPLKVPDPYTPDGQLIFSTGRSTDVAQDTEMDVQRFVEELAALTPGNQVKPLTAFSIDPHFQNGYIGTWNVGLEQDFKSLKLSASYVGTAGIKMPATSYPNGYTGADPAFSPYTLYDSEGRISGGYGLISLMGSRSHSTYHGFQAGLGKTSASAGLQFQANYSFSKSLDDASAVQNNPPQDPRNWRAERGPSSFDVTQAFSISLVKDLPVDKVFFLRPLGQRFTTGWQAMGIGSLSSGLPFTVLSGIQQTGVGSSAAGTAGADRPDQVAEPVFSTARSVREDYFGMGAQNPAFFSIPINVPDGSGPNQGRFGTLGRNTFRGPGFRNLDFSLIKDTPLGRKGRAEALSLQFRAEFFNVFNLVNFALPANAVLGPGFGIINKTAGTSRQIQFSLKLFY
jgi:hypothetical protein